MTNLKALLNNCKTGSEPFHNNGTELPATLLNFWQWSSSEIVGNALRGMLAEYIVASALNCAEGARQQWEAYDLLTSDGVKVEVKSGAYLQRWSQRRLSPISFGIQPSKGRETETGARTSERKRKADVYIFCVLKHQDKKTVDPLNMAQWEFYILATHVLDESLGMQKTLSLSRLKSLGPVKVDYDGINDAVLASAI